MWNNCKKIYENGDFICDIDREILNSFHRYTTLIRREPTSQVWFDTKEKKCFGPEQDFYANPSEFSFFSQQETFIDNPRWGHKAIISAYGQYFNQDMIQSKELMYVDNSTLSDVKGKDILIVGAGPTGEKKYWENTKYDQLWSCTKFYNSPVLSKMKVDLASVGGEVALEDPNFLRYINEHNTTVGFEGGVTPIKLKKSLPIF